MDNFIKYIKSYAISFTLSFIFIVYLTYLNCLHIIWNVNVENFILLAIILSSVYSWLKTTIKYSYNLFGPALNLITLTFMLLLYAGVFHIFYYSLFTNILSIFIYFVISTLCVLQIIKLVTILFSLKQKASSPTMHKFDHVKN